MFKFRAILRRNLTASVVDGTFDERISWVKVVLRFDIDDELDAFFGWCKRKETNIECYCAFGIGCTLIVDTVNFTAFSGFGFVRCLRVNAYCTNFRLPGLRYAHPGLDSCAPTGRWWLRHCVARVFCFTLNSD